MSRLRYFGVAVVLWSLAGVIRAQDQIEQLPASEPAFAVKRWDTSNGLPQNSVTALERSTDGYLWIGTFGGLVRFDGISMESFDVGDAPELGSNRIAALDSSSDGTLWVLTDPPRLARCEKGRFSVVSIGQERHSIPTLLVDRTDTLWIGTDRGLAYLTQEGFVWPEWAASLRVNRLRLARDGRILAATSGGIFAVTKTDRTLLCREGAYEVAQTTDGRIYLGSYRGLERLRDGKLESLRKTLALSAPVWSLFPADDGALWVGSEAATSRLAREWLDHPVGDELRPRGQTSSLAAHSFASDGEGGIWLDWRPYGLARLSPREFTSWAGKAGLSREAGNTMQFAQGALFLGLHDGLWERRDGAFRKWKPDHPVGTQMIQAMLSEDDGRFWVAHNNRITCFAGESATTFGPSDGLPDDYARALLRTRAGELLIGTRDGLFTIDGRRCVPFMSPESIERDNVKVLVEGSTGDLWVGGMNYLQWIAPDRTSSLAFEVGRELPPGEIRAVFFIDGETWVATYGSGFFRLTDGNVTGIVDESRGLFNDHTCSVVVYDEYLVVSTNLGMYVVPQRELKRVADGKSPSVACRPIQGTFGAIFEGNGGVQPSAARRGDELWFSTVRGPVSIDMGRLPALNRSPTCRVERVTTAEGTFWDVDRFGQSLTTRSMEIRLRNPSFIDAETTRFRWRLRGRGEEWSPVSFDRRVRFTDLLPGDYVFEAVAVNFNGVESPTPAVVEFSVTPRLWERTGVRIIFAVSVALMAFATFRAGSNRSARRAVRRETELAAIVDARTSELREARDSLDLRVRERTRELNEALERLRRDIERRLKLEAEVRQLQRMESLGQLAGGVAHDFNNLLTVVLMCAHELEATHRDNPDVAAMAAAILEAGERGRRLAQHLLAVASRQVVRPEVIDLVRAVTDLQNVLMRMLGPEIEFVFRHDDRPATILAAAAQIEQILMNLCVNSRDAMPEKGRFEITIRREGEGEDETILLIVADTGVGMTPEVRERAFDPFFTTKPHGLGTGLGLSTVYGIVKQLGGTIAVESESGNGCTFTIFLPYVARPSEEAVDNDELSAPQRLDAVVLLIEDEDAVRAAMQRLLESLSCRVVAVPDGNAAMTALRDDPAIEVCLSDLVIPGLRGKDLVRALRAVRPELGVVFVSGAVDRSEAATELRDAGCELLPKPPKPAHVATALGRALRLRGI